MSYEEIVKESLELSEEQKARLIHELVSSLDGTSAHRIEEIWLDEAERRDREMDESGDIGVSGKESLQRIRSHLGRNQDRD